MNPQLVVKCINCGRELCGDSLIDKEHGYILKEIPICDKCLIEQNKRAFEEARRLFKSSPKP